jgi:archaellum component FlaC
VTKVEDDKLFDLMTKMYGEMQSGFQKLDNEIESVKEDLSGVKEDVKSVKERLIDIEINHGKKLDLLFDGYKQNTEKLDRVEKQVSKQEEFILKRVK